MTAHSWPSHNRYALGRYGEALTLQEEALLTFEAVVGPTHPSVLVDRPVHVPPYAVDLDLRLDKRTTCRPEKGWAKRPRRPAAV
jgi:hypothetical protein